MTIPTIMLGWLVLAVIAIVGGVWLHNVVGSFLLTFGIVGFVAWSVFVFETVKDLYTSR